jgi:centromere protein O
MFFWHSVEISINDDEWNDGLLATIREKVFNVCSTPFLFNFLSQETDYLFCEL